MKRTILILCLAAISVLPAAAVSWFMGFEGGYAYNYYNIDTQYAYDMRYTGASGFTAGIPVQVNIFDWLAVRMDLQYQQKNHKMYRTHTYSDQYTNTHDHYLQLPVLVNFSFGGERVRGYASAGGYMGYWLASRREGVAIGVSNTNTDIFYHFDEYRTLDTKHDCRFDAGLAGNVGLRVKIDERMAFFAEAAVFYSLVSTEKTKDVVAPTPRYNTTCALQVGLQFALDRQVYINHKNSKKQ